MPPRQDPPDPIDAAWQGEPLRHFAPALRDAARRVEVSAGEVLFRTGQQPAWLHFVVSGEAVMSRCDRDGRCLALQRARGTFLAEASLHSTQYHCDAHAGSDALLLSFPIRALRSAIDGHEPTRWAWIAMLASEIRRQRSNAERLSLKTVRERLLHLLVTQADNGRLPLAGTRKDLAAQLGVSHEALYRCLATLVRDGVVRVDDRALTLL